MVENGVECLRSLEERDYGLVLMDCQMPIMHGFQATQHIRELEKSCLEKRDEQISDVRPWVAPEGQPLMPIIALTTYATKVTTALSLPSLNHAHHPPTKTKTPTLHCLPGEWKQVS